MFIKKKDIKNFLDAIKLSLIGTVPGIAVAVVIGDLDLFQGVCGALVCIFCYAGAAGVLDRYFGGD